MTTTYILIIVFLSLLLAVFAASTALGPGDRIVSTSPRALKYWLLAAAMGTGIWSIHFLDAPILAILAGTGGFLVLLLASIAVYQVVARKQHTYFNKLLEEQQSLFMVDAAGRITFINRETENLFGYTKGELLGQPLDILHRPTGTVEDMTPRYHTRLAPQTGRMLFDELLGNLKGMVYRCKNDRDWTLEYVSDGITSLTGYTPREFIEERTVTFGQLIHPEDAEQVWDTVQAGLKEHSPYEILYRIITCNGDIKFVVEHGYGVYDDDGQLLYLQGLVIDDTQRVQTEQDLHLIQFCLEHAPDSVFWIDQDGRTTYVNEQACRGLGYTRQELTGVHVWDYDPNFRKEGWPRWWEQSHKLSARTFESQHRRKNGEIFPVEISTVHVTYGDKVRHLAFARDITERKQAELAVTQLAERLNLATNAAHLGIWDWYIPENKLIWDDRMFELYGVKKEDFGGAYEAWLAGVHPDDRARCDEAIQQALRNEKPYDIEFRVRWPDDTIHVIKADGQVVRDAEGRPLRMTGINYDITENKQAEETLQTLNERLESLVQERTAELQRSYSLLQAAFDSTADGLLVVDTAGKITAASRRFFEMWHIPEHLARAGSDDALLDFVLDQLQDPGAFLRKVRKLYAQPAQESSDVLEFSDGRVFERYSQPQFFGGKIVGRVWCFRDVSERARALKTLRESEERYRDVVESATDVIYTTDLNGNFTYSNPAGLKTIGCSLEDLKKYNYLDLILPDHRQRVSRIYFRQYLAKTPSSIVEFPFHTFTGNVCWFSQSASLMLDQGKPVGFHVIARDITERKRAEDALLESEERFRVLAQSSPVGIFRSDSGGICQYVNPTYARILGRTEEQCLGLNWQDAHHPGDRDYIARKINKALELRKNIDIEYRIVRPDGEVRWVHGVGAPYYEGDSLKWYIGMIEDITVRKQAEEDLIQAKEEAEKASQAKSQFLARMSHELRTPMNAIIVSAQLLEIKQPSDDQIDNVREIMQASRHLLDMINELLDLSRIEAGRLHVTIEPLNPAAIVAEAINLVWPLVEKKNLMLHNQTAPGNGLPVMADSTRLRQVLVNLLSNAAKYNQPGGSILIDCSLVTESRLRLSITDTGQGIASDKQSLLFQPFETLGAEIVPGADSTGIGLALSKRLVELMGGEIGVTSIIGEGTTFWVDLPRAVHLPAVPLNAIGRTGGATYETHIKVLYVEDNAANMRVTQRVLALYPFLTLIAAVNGETGLGLARAHHPDVILLDIHLPDIDGYEVLKCLRNDPVTASIPVIAISADAMPLDINRGLRAGFLRYLTKPIDVQELIEAISSALPTGDDSLVTRH